MGKLLNPQTATRATYSLKEELRAWPWWRVKHYIQTHTSPRRCLGPFSRSFFFSCLVVLLALNPIGLLAHLTPYAREYSYEWAWEPSMYCFVPLDLFRKDKSGVLFLGLPCTQIQMLAWLGTPPSPSRAPRAGCKATPYQRQGNHREVNCLPTQSQGRTEVR